MRQQRSLLAALKVMCVLLAGCSTMRLGGPVGSDTGETACRDTFSDARCNLIELDVRQRLNVGPDAISSILVLPDTCGDQVAPNGDTVLCTRLGGPPLNVRATLTDGASRELFLGCIGVDMRPICTDEPTLRIGVSFNRDVPCPGDPPDGCATPVPTANVAARSKAVPLKVDRLDIPIDHVGDYRVKVGEAKLPNGQLTHAEIALVDDWPAGVTILSGSVRMDLESLEADGKPFSNAYEHGWRNGIERVAAYVIFHVDAFEPGAVLPIRDVLVS
jgi:predicted small secreted protein